MSTRAHILLTSATLLLSNAQHAKADEATDDVRSRAISLFEQGRQSMRAGDLASACARFSESLALLPSPGTLLNLAACESQQGDRLSAQEHYTAFLDLADPEDDRRAIALRGLTRILGQPSALGPTSAVPVSASARASTSSSTSPKRPSAATATDAPAAPSAGRSNLLQVAGIFTGSAALASFGVATFFAVRAVDLNNRSISEGCKRDECPPNAALTRLDARTAGNTATIATVAGGALTLGAAVIYLLARHGDRSSSSESPSLAITHSRGGVAVLASLKF